MSDFRQNDNDERGGIPIWVHIAIICTILVIVLFAAMRLLKWNKGTTIDTSDVDPTEYEVEMLDQIFTLPAEKLEGHEQDDKETILVFGNDAVTYDSSESGICAQIAEKTGAEVINAGFPETTIALKNATYDDSYKLDRFSFYNAAMSVASGDFSEMESTAQGMDDPTYLRAVQTLSGVDYNAVDTIVIYYNASDYVNLRPGMNPNDSLDSMTYMGALDAGIRAIQEKYPFIRIVCMSFTFCYAYDSDGTLKNGDMVDFGNGRLTTYLQHMIDACGDTGVSFIDNYYGTIDETNSAEFLLDNIHVNQACNEHIAAHFADVIYGM